MVEILLVMVIIGILAVTIFISVGNQRKKAKMNAVLQTAKAVHAISQECYFRVGDVDLPNNAQIPTNEVCQHSKTTWMPIAVDECVYSPVGGTSDHYYGIECSDFSQEVECGIRASEDCEIKNMP